MRLLGEKRRNDPYSYRYSGPRKRGLLDWLFNNMWAMFLVIIAIGLIANFVQAHFIYHDYRCMLAHCRIVKH